MTCGGRSWAGPERGSEIPCVLTHGMGSTPPHHHHHYDIDDDVDEDHYNIDDDHYDIDDDVDEDHYDIPTTLTVWDLWTDPVGVAALLDVWGEKLGGPQAGV